MTVFYILDCRDNFSLEVNSCFFCFKKKPRRHPLTLLLTKCSNKDKEQAMHIALHQRHMHKPEKHLAVLKKNANSFMHANQPRCKLNAVNQQKGNRSNSIITIY